jgi:CheY-like chemotaxis protein
MAKRQPTVLVVDDHDDGANSLALILRRSQFDVRVARDGPAALAAVAEREPEVLILDIGLPGMNGWRLAGKLREIMARKPLLVALSGFGRSEDVERSKAAGFDYHFLKPADPADLVTYIRQHRPLSSDSQTEINLGV